VSRPDGEFGTWFDAKVAAGFTSKEVLCDNRIVLNRSKEPIKGLLSCSRHGRIWAFDINQNSGAKGWIWTDCLGSFIDIYAKIPEADRHAYEVIEENKPCRMVYDLDMCTAEGLNTDKDDSEMARLIGKSCMKMTLYNVCNCPCICNATK
jgi:hypothetical protein